MRVDVYRRLCLMQNLPQTCISRKISRTRQAVRTLRHEKTDTIIGILTHKYKVPYILYIPYSVLHILGGFYGVLISVLLSVLSNFGK